MNVTININLNVNVFLGGFEELVMARARELVEPVQADMASRYAEVVRGNFGREGVDRPAVWPPLSPAYARKVNRTYATLYVSGALFDAVKVDAAAGRVSASNADVPYATVHQTGGGNNIPPRPYFPILDNGNPTEYAVAEVLDAAERAVRRELSK